MHIVNINLTTYEYKQEEHIYLQSKYISDFIEYAPQRLLVASYTDCSYYLVDLENKTERLLVKGFSPYALGLQLFPYFNLATFPYVLAKEDDFMTILNIELGFAFRLCNVATHNQNYLNQRCLFLNDKTFITDEGSYNLSKYKISD